MPQKVPNLLKCFNCLEKSFLNKLKILKNEKDLPAYQQTLGALIFSCYPTQALAKQPI